MYWLAKINNTKMNLNIKILREKFADSGERTKKLLLGSGVMALSTFISTITRVGMISLLARIYTKDQFGIWVAITSATAVMSTSDFGIGNALRNKLAALQVMGPDGDEDARSYFFSVVYFFLAVAAVLSVVLLAFRHQIPYEEVFKTKNLFLQSQGVNILIAVEIIFLVGIPMGIGATMFFAYQEATIVAIFTIANGAIGLLVVGVLAWVGQSIVVTAVSFFVINLLINIVATSYFLFRRKWGPFNLKVRSMFSRVWSLLALSFTFAILQISGAFIYNSVTLVATANISLSDAAQLNLVQKLYTVVVALYLSFYNPLWAGYADAIHKNEWLWVKKTLTKTIQITSALFGISMLIFTFYGNFFLKILAGNSYVSEKRLFLSMGLWALVYSLYSMGVAFLSALGKIKLITALTSLFAILFLYGAVLVSKKWGIFGISYMSVLMYLILAIATYSQSFIITNKFLKKNENN